VTVLGVVVPPIQNINKAASASRACFKVIDAPQLKEGGLRAPEVQATSDIRFENVRFTYPSRPRTEIVKGLTLELPAGKITALVGPSGCGKSTIVGLLERWYQLSDVNAALPFVEEQKDGVPKSTEERKAENKAKKEAKKAKKRGEKSPAEIQQEMRDAEAGPILQNSGAIFVGKHNIEALDRKWWRSQIGLVQQEPFLFDESIYDNVVRGLVGSPWQDEPVAKKQELVEEACKEAFADEFIRRLPDGYKTLVGESGIKLSGGQRQRLAIARSIIKRPAILIFDEATSSIDVRGERIVQAALDRVSKNRTTITIAHRLSTIKKADHIVVLKEGVAVEEGTHDELVTREDGVYANLVRAQHLELGSAENEHAEALELDDDDLALEKTRSKASKLGDADETSATSATAGYKPRGFINSVGRFLYEQRQHRLIYSLIFLGALGGGAVFAMQAYLFSHLIVVFQYTGAHLISAGNFWSLMFFVLALCVAVCYALIGFYTNSLSVYVSTTYRQEYFESILNKPVPWFDSEDHSSGTLTARLSNDPQQLQEILGPNMALPLVAVFNVMGCTIISFAFGWKLTLVTFFAALPVILAAAFMRIRYEVQFEAFNAKVFAESSKFAAESIGAFRTVTALTLEDTITRHYRGLLDEHVRKAFKKGRYAVLIFALSDSLELCCMALTFWYGGQLLGNHEYGVMQFFIIYVAIVQGGQSAGQFLAFGPNIAQATAASNRILGFRSEPEVTYETHETSETSAARLTEGNEGFEIEFRNVGFIYPTRDVPVFKRLSFTIARGAYVAFVGPSGCGKTTVISLLERFYSVSSGQIFIDGLDMAQVPLGPYRSACALVSQEPTLFEGTVRENLVLGLESGASDEEVEEACRAAEIHDFIISLPQSYATPVSAGTHASLSGGQKQRLCIARALLRKPRLLLLDEATSSLDSQSESLVQKAIEKVAGSGKVTIAVVAHRLATVQNAGRIVVLGEGGRILEEGRHADLVQQRGVYWGMCRAQALDR
jgi:ATP-binding cassette subfamily B (MDR/TAP) protein 1